MALRFLIAWVALAALAPISAAAEAPARELQLTPLVAEVVAPPGLFPVPTGSAIWSMNSPSPT